MNRSLIIYSIASLELTRVSDYVIRLKRVKLEFPSISDVLLKRFSVIHATVLPGEVVKVGRVDGI